MMMLILNQRSSQNEGRRSKIPRRCSGDFSHHFHHHHNHHHCHRFFHHHCHLPYYNYHDDLRCAGRLSTTIKTITTTTTTTTTTTIRLSLLFNSHLLYHANMFHSTKTILLRLQRLSSPRRRKSLSRQLCHNSNRSIHISDHALTRSYLGMKF